MTIDCGAAPDRVQEIAVTEGGVVGGDRLLRQLDAGLACPPAS